MKNKLLKGKKFGKLTLKVESYSNNDRLAIILYNKNDEIYGVVTANLDIPIFNIDEGFLSNDFAPEFGVISKLKEIGIIEKSFDFIPYNMGKYEKVKFNLDKLKEYDFEGVTKYIEDKNIVDDKEIESMSI